ncbi:MAG: amidohydrolase family protein [Planctomycetota bacterium]|jgi:predicted TIM-barrel fold metal-dependent hydrolase
MPICNCHIHTFTVDCIPKKFIPFPFQVLFKLKIIRKLVCFLLNKIDPLDKRDLFQRYSNIIKIAHLKTQKAIFKFVKVRYPLDTKFIVLPMDMEFMEAGEVPKSWREQHEELAKLAKDNSDAVIPFIAVDPNRSNILHEIKQIEDKFEIRFRGIKLYPPLGYFPTDPGLKPIYEFAKERSLPIIAHCAKGGVRNRKLDKTTCTNFAHPRNYAKILKEYPEVKICLAHFGGDIEWDRLLKVGANFTHPSLKDNWVKKIIEMIVSGKYPNLYTDISYTIFNFAEYIPILKVILTDRKDGDKISEHVLLGSDYYMIEQERFSEKQLSMMLRAEIGEELFWKIAEANPQNFLQ